RPLPAGSTHGVPRRATVNHHPGLPALLLANNLLLSDCSSVFTTPTHFVVGGTGNVDFSLSPATARTHCTPNTIDNNLHLQ
ncbi:hypothetical protein, partial [Serratia marcescens]|uniref:hypothetical protein n=1 Tax=Serratia marcescens TaxID=615 RepID=UPI001BD27447